MFRILIPLESVTIAHVARPLQVARALRERGMEVVFGTAPRYRCLIEKAGFEAHPLFCVEPPVLLDCVRTLNFRRQNESLDAYLEADLELAAKAGRIDLILSDFRFTARFAAKKLGIPHAALVNGFFSPYYGILPELPRAVAPFLPASIRKNRLLRQMIKSAVPRWHARAYRRLCRRHGIEDRISSGFDFSVSDDLTLLCDLPEFTPQKNMPAHYHFIGPLLWEPEEGYETVPDGIQGSGRPLIYVSLGTSGEARAFEILIEALSFMPYDVILSTGGAVCKDLPPHITAAPFVKPSGILQKARLMICHGGNGSIYQALSHGVPVLCLPSFYDQEWNAQRVVDLRLGGSFFCRDFSPSALRVKIEEILQNSVILRNARAFRERIAGMNAPEEAAGKIEDYLRQRSLAKPRMPVLA